MTQNRWQNRVYLVYVQFPDVKPIARHASCALHSAREDGDADGLALGLCDGDVVGLIDGPDEGDALGEAVGASVTQHAR